MTNRFWRRMVSLPPTTASKTPSPHPALQIHVAEYNSLRQEVLGRMTIQSQAFNYLLIVIGAAATAIVTGLDNARQPYFPAIVLLVAVVLPLVSAPLGLIFFDNEMVLHAIGSYIAERWVGRTRALAEDAPILGNIWEFVNLPDGSADLHRQLSQGRWILFLLPTVVPTLWVGLCAMAETFGSGRDLVAAVGRVEARGTFALSALWAAFAINAVLTTLLLRGVYWSWKTPR